MAVARLSSGSGAVAANVTMPSRSPFRSTAFQRKSAEGDGDAAASGGDTPGETSTEAAPSASRFEVADGFPVGPPANFPPPFGTLPADNQTPRNTAAASAAAAAAYGQSHAVLFCGRLGGVSPTAARPAKDSSRSRSMRLRRLQAGHRASIAASSSPNRGSAHGTLNF